MRRTRAVGTAAAVVVTVLAAATPAWAHEEITPQTFRTGQPTFFHFSAANEHNAALVKVTLAAPPGLPFGATTSEPSGWTVERTDSQIVWSGGSVAPNHYEQWGFEVEGADQPSTFAYHATLIYMDGASANVEVDTTATPVTKNPGPVGGAALPARSTTPTVAIVALLVALLSALLSGTALLVSRGRRDMEDPAPSGQEW